MWSFFMIGTYKQDIFILCTYLPNFVWSGWHSKFTTSSTRINEKWGFVCCKKVAQHYRFTIHYHRIRLVVFELSTSTVQNTVVHSWPGLRTNTTLRKTIKLKQYRLRYVYYTNTKYLIINKVKFIICFFNFKSLL